MAEMKEMSFKPYKPSTKRKQLYATRNKLTRTFTDIITSPNEVTKDDFVAMDFGKFFIGKSNKGLLISVLAGFLQRGDFELALLPVIARKTIFYADIDDKPDNVTLDIDAF